MLKFMKGKLVKEDPKQEEQKTQPTTEQVIEPVQKVYAQPIPVQPLPVQPLPVKDKSVKAYKLEIALKNQEANLSFFINTDEELEITCTEIVNAITKKECVEVQNCIINSAEILFIIYEYTDL